MRAKTMLTALAIAVSLAASTAMAENAEQKAMAQKIARGLKSSGELQDYRVGVKYEDGVAWLIGTVTSNDQKQTALRLARKMDGVSHVVSKLEISGGEEAASASGSKGDSVSGISGDFADSLKLASMQASSSRKRGSNSTQRRPQSRNQSRNSARNQSRNPRMARRNSQMPLPAARIGQQGPSPRGMMQARGMQQGQMRQGQMPMGRGRVNPANYSQGAPGMMAPMPGGRPGGAPGHVPGGGVQGASYDQGNMPGYAWPSYSAQSNYASLTYPKQYSASAWPYIGPFYPYPQVPLGWRKVSLEWDDGWWFLDFNDTRTH